MRKIWDIHGGVHPPENKTQSNQSPIRTLALPRRLIVPLGQHIGALAQTAVAVGEKVLKGQCIANAQGMISAPVHAPSSGTVVAIENRPIAHPSGLSAPCIVIDTDGEDRWLEREMHSDWHALDAGTLIDTVRAAGIAGMGGAGFPTSVKLVPHSEHSIDTLIINGTECEPYITADDVSMREYAEEIIEGVEIIAKILGYPAQVMIGIEDNKPEACAAMQHALAQRSNDKAAIEIVSFPTKYPSGGEKQLIQILTGREVPSGKVPAQIGMVVQNVGTARAVYRAIAHGEPLISRVTTVVGRSLKEQGNAEVLIGTPIDDALNAFGFDAGRCARLIIGGPMMGYAIQNLSAPVVKTTNCLLVPDHGEMPAPLPAQACIRCGLCAEACPASLLPQQLYWFSRSEDFDRARSHNLFDCIECGACSYVCPSNIPLVQYYRATKSAIRQHDDEKRKSEHARQRFEFRKARLETAEAEKEAKRLARKRAAEENTLREPAAETPKDTKAALQTQAAGRHEEGNDTAKLARALSSAESRLERARKQLDEARLNGADDNRLSALTARIKEAELKVSEAQSRLLSAGEPGSANEVRTGGADKLREKIQASPRDKLEQTIQTLEKRLDTARQKAAEAQSAGQSTAEALAIGVTKLEAKLLEARAEMAQLAPLPPSEQHDDDATQNAAESAILRAQQRAAELAEMSPEQKRGAQRNSLISRIEKARARLAEAEAAGSEHVDTLRATVEKLEAKLKNLA